MDLVIVESPKKAKTIAKYLGSGYEVIASGGHVSDLPASASTSSIISSRSTLSTPTRRESSNR